MSDEATYESTIEEVKKTDGNQFLQVITMQNHMHTTIGIRTTIFKAESTTDTPLEDDEKESIETYQKGAALTDEATADFLDKLDAIDKPITVVFYGDHLPGIYSSASEDDNNSLALHLTDYFIWSNKASSSQGNEIDNADYSSPNFFVAQAAEHMNAKCPRIWRSSRKCMRKSPPWSHLSSTISRDGTVSLKVRTSISTLTAIPWPKATSTRKPAVACRLPADSVRYHHREELPERHRFHGSSLEARGKRWPQPIANSRFWRGLSRIL